MFETEDNSLGILEMIIKNWPKDKQERAIKEYKTSKNQRVSVMIKRKPKPEIEPASFENYRPVIDDDGEEYVPMSERK